VAYEPQANGHAAVVQTHKDGIVLWDALHHPVAQLADDSDLFSAAFSPDGSAVAVLTCNAKRDWLPDRLRLYDTSSGKLLHELFAFELKDDRQGFGQVAWTPDGRYVLADAVEDYSGDGGVNVWNARTGKHRGQLTGVKFRCLGFGVLPQVEQVVASDQDGHIRFWDLSSALKQIHDFEEPLDAR
jgi:WD40 repeat protein